MTVSTVLSFVALSALFLSTAISAVSLSQDGQKKNDHDGDGDDDDVTSFNRVLQYLDDEDIDNAHALLVNRFDRSARNPDPTKRQQPLSHRKISLGGGTTYTTEYKLRHDIEQLEYLLSTAESSQISQSLSSLITDEVLPTYREVLSNRIPPLEELIQTPTQGLFQFQRDDLNGIMRFYNRALHVPDVPEVNGARSMFNSDTIDLDKIQKQWDETGIVVIDNLLSSEALQIIRQRVMYESTMWYQTKLPHKFGGYTGAYIDDGLHARILLQLAVQLRQLLPQLLEGHPLKYMWAYKYDSDYTGINLHADEAAVNVNIWLTPDDANLDKDSGGLVIYTVKPPSDWDFEQYNRNTDFVYKELIEPSNGANVTIPYKENRAVIFDSAFFHTTDKFLFKKGYKNRRINLTLLYGDMQKTKTSSSTSTSTPNARTEQEL